MSLSVLAGELRAIHPSTTQWDPAPGKELPTLLFVALAAELLAGSLCPDRDRAGQKFPNAIAGGSVYDDWERVFRALRDFRNTILHPAIVVTSLDDGERVVGMQPRWLAEKLLDGDDKLDRPLGELLRRTPSKLLHPRVVEWSLKRLQLAVDQEHKRHRH